MQTPSKTKVSFNCMLLSRNMTSSNLTGFCVSLCLQAKIIRTKLNIGFVVCKHKCISLAINCKQILNHLWRRVQCYVINDKRDHIWADNK